MVEVGLVDRGAGETVFDMDVNVVFSQAELRFLAVGVDGDKSTAAMLAAGDECAASSSFRRCRFSFSSSFAVAIGRAPVSFHVLSTF